MPIQTLQVPAGVYRHGTDLEGLNRWRDVNLIRWRNGTIQPVGGWEEVSLTGDSISGVPRNSIAWFDNAGDPNSAVATFSNLYYVSSTGVVSDITPSGFTSGNESANVNIGYGGYDYNVGSYGVERPDSGVFEECTTWSLDTWGEYLVACSVDDGKLYEWQLNTASPAAVITNAPTNNLGLVVTEERFLFALGADGNPRKVQWSDKEDNTTWTPLATNEAGDFILQTSGEIMSGHRLRGRTLILTTTDAHVATYIGPQLVYGFEMVGRACGVVSRNACVANQEGAIWMGENAFYSFNGSAVQELPCEVLDYVFNGMNKAQRSKVFAVDNTKFSEVWWFYPSESSNEINKYVIYSYKEGHWSIGELNRTTGYDSGVFNNPVMFSSTAEMYQHEKNFDWNGGKPYAETGPIVLTNEIVKVNTVIPDEDNKGNTQMLFKTRFYPNGDEYTYGPYQSGEPSSVRFSGRQFRMRIDPQFDVNYSAMTSAILKAATRFSPELDLFSVEINGRLLGDVNNDGRITSADSLAYSKWSAGIPNNQDEADYIENVLNPYVIENYLTYYNYLNALPRDWRFGLPRLNVINGGGR